MPGFWHNDATSIVTERLPPGRLRLSAHLGYLFGELPLVERFAAARRAGFGAIEIPDPYGFSASDFRSLCEENNLAVAQIAVPNGVSAATRKGLAALPGREREFEDALMRSIAFAKAVNCRLIHPMSGIRTPFGPAPKWDTYLSNLDRACSAAAGEGLCVIIEPISTHGIRNYFLDSLWRACAAIELVKAPNLMLSFDTYHAAAMGVHLRSFTIKNSAKIAHVQVADWPSRNEPGSGLINFDEFFSALSDCGYRGYLGLEYIPSAKGEGSFDWTRRFEASLAPLGADTAAEQA